MIYEEDTNDYGECDKCGRVHDDPYTCESCGTVVCYDCFDYDTGLCADCEDEKDGCQNCFGQYDGGDDYTCPCIDAH